MGKSGNGAGKGDSPRSCFSQQFRDNFDKIFGKKEFSNLGVFEEEPEVGNNEEISKNEENETGDLSESEKTILANLNND